MSVRQVKVHGRKVWHVTLLATVVLLAACEQSKFGMTEAERKQVYLTLLAERVTQSKALEQEAAEWSAKAQRTLNQARAYLFAPKVAEALTKQAASEVELSKNTYALSKNEVIIDLRARMALEKRTGVKLDELEAIREEGQVKGWKGVAR